MNRKEKRRLVAAVLLLLCAGLLSATGGQEAKPAYPTTEDGKIKIVFWTHGRHDLVFMNDQVARFNATNKENAFVILESHTEKITEEVALGFESGQAPDIFSRAQAVDEYAKMGRIANLMPLLTPEARKRFEPWFTKGRNLRPGPSGDLILVALPNGFGSTYRFIWNKDLFRAAGLDPEKPPTTFQELVAYAKKITQYGATQEPRKYGFGWPGVESDVWEYWCYYPATDSGLFWFDYDSLKYNFSVYKPILQAYRQMYLDGSLFPGILQLQWDPPRAQFAEGNIGMYFAADWDVGVFTDQFPAKIQWGVAPNPTLTGKKVGKTFVSGGWGAFYVNGLANPVTQRAAERFLEFNTSLAEQVKYYEGGYGTAAMADITANAKPPANPHSKGFAAVDDVSYPLWPPPVELEGESVYEVFNRITLGNVNIDEALADLDKRMNEGLQRTWDAGTKKKEDYYIKGWQVPKSGK